MRTLSILAFLISFLLPKSIAGIDTIGLSFPTIVVDVDEEFCIPLYAEQFNEVLGFMIGVGYDTSVLEYYHLIEGPLTFITDNSVVDSQVIAILWFFNDQPETVPDDIPICEICFKAVGQPGEVSPLEFVEFDRLTLTAVTINGIAEIRATSGSVQILPAEIVPTMSGWGIVIVFLLLSIVGVVGVVRVQRV